MKNIRSAPWVRSVHLPQSAIRRRLQQFWDAGADHICIQAIHPSGSRTQIGERIFDLLAPASA